MLQRLWKALQSSRVGRSVFRVGLPASNLERAQVAISSFFLHFQPASTGYLRPKLYPMEAPSRNTLPEWNSLVFPIM